MKRSLRRFLKRRGATDAEIGNAARAGYLALLVLDREILPGARKYDTPAVAAQAGTDVATARVVWRALGFPDLPDDLPAFTDGDVEALRGFLERVESPMMLEWSLDRALAQARVLSSALARAADTETDDIAHSFAVARAAGMDDEALAGEIADRLRFDVIAKLIDHAHRLQLRAAIWRRLAGGELHGAGTVESSVGFVDLVGYTALSQMLEDDELSRLLERFGTLTHEAVAGAGGRIVKTIGDEIMYITDTAPTAAAIAVDLVEETERDEVLPEVRAGVACGTLLSHEGDYFGPVVNLASRLTELARPSTVLVSAELAEAVSGDDRFKAQRIPSRKIRDIGRVEVYRLERGKQRVS
jgi:adenylate cyclase